MSRRTVIRWEAGECLPITTGHKRNRSRLYGLIRQYREYDTEAP